MKLKVVTVARLRKLDACNDQVERFAEVFGRSAEITPANLTKAWRRGLDIKWLAEQVAGNHTKYTKTGRCLSCLAWENACKTILAAAARG